MTTLLKTVCAALLLLGLLVFVKVRFEHQLAPSTSGLQGSSHTRQGYDVAALEKMTGRKAFVVAYDGLDMAGMLPIVKAIISNPATRPRVLVIEAYAANLAGHPKIDDPRLFFDAPPAMKWELMRTYLQSHRDFKGWLDVWTLAASRGSELILSYPLVYRAIDGLSYNGGYINKIMPGVPPKVMPMLRVPVRSTEIDADQLQAAHAIVALAALDRVKIIFADPPMPAPVEAQPQMVALQGRFKAIAAGAGIPYIDGAEGFPTADPAMFTDSNHLSTAGRELYTSRFAQAIKPELP